MHEIVLCFALIPSWLDRGAKIDLGVRFFAVPQLAWIGVISMLGALLLIFLTCRHDGINN